MSRKYDLVVFGASGFTGKYVVEEIVKLEQRSPEEKFTWAVSGRSVKKLDEILKEVKDATGQDIKDVDKIIADVQNPDSLREMAKQCKVVVNCVGPYRFFGEAVVKACIEEGTHHVDVSGEPYFLEKMQLDYGDLAREKGVYIIGSCGFDSIPNDVGVEFLKQNFEGDLNSVESYLETDNQGKKGGLHYGTWQSAIHGIGFANLLRPLRRKLFKETLPKPPHKMLQRGVLHFNEEVQSWCLPFPGSDRPVVMRTQRFFYVEEKLRPLQMQAYVKMKSLFGAICMIMGAIIFGVMAQFKVTRYLLEKYPKLFSFGMASHEGPSKESMEALKFTFTIIGTGWDKKLKDETDIHSGPPRKKMTVKVSGTNPGYGATCICLIFSALTIIREKDKLPKKAGVITPGYAFAKTSLVDKLNKNGVTFKVVK